MFWGANCQDLLMGFKLDLAGEAGGLLGVSEEPENNSMIRNSREMLVDQPQKMKKLPSQMLHHQQAWVTSRRRNWKL